MANAWIAFFEITFTSNVHVGKFEPRSSVDLWVLRCPNRLSTIVLFLVSDITRGALSMNFQKVGRVVGALGSEAGFAGSMLN